MEPGSRISSNSGLNSCVSFSHYVGRVQTPSFQAASLSSSMSIFSDCGDRSKKKSIGTLSTPTMANAAAAMKVCGLPFVHWGHEYYVRFDGGREQISNLASFCCSSMSVRNSLLPTAASMPATRKLIVRQQCLHLHRTRHKEPVLGAIVNHRPMKAFHSPRATPKCTSENGSVMSVLPCGRARRWRESCKRRFAYASRLPSPDPR